MGITRLTAIIIQTNDVSVETFRGTNEKYGFLVSRKEGEHYGLLLDTPPYSETQEQAQADGDSIVREIKEMDLEAIV
jgi:hypothetical protein